ncbi:MAG TPA: dTDP-4-dehydrorhamnose 3,5-epimerase family protein [Steroidobacteraceae bacterium]|jgi:dTDP-4-dehydrorhamnose 3,5-epimerase
MILSETAIEGAYIVEPQRHTDARGYFVRHWCQREFAQAGLNVQIVQSSASFNLHRHTVRGMHLQVPPALEGKLIRCVAGAIYDVIIDLRPESRTFLQHLAVELTAENGRALFVPPVCAHGFQTLVDRSEVSYMMTGFYDAERGRGFRWNDPAFGIRWPETRDVTILPRDAQYEDFSAAAWKSSLAANSGHAS